MPTRLRQPAKNSRPASHKDEPPETSYGARINRLFRDAIRDLEELKQSPSGETPK